MPLCKAYVIRIGNVHLVVLKLKFLIFNNPAHIPRPEIRPDWHPLFLLLIKMNGHEKGLPLFNLLLVLC